MQNKKLVVKANGIKTLKDASIIRNTLKKVDGVKFVKVSLKNKKVTLIHNKVINVLEIRKIINDLGYKYIGVE